MEIDTGVCKLRHWNWQDRDALVQHANNFKIWLNLRDRFPHPYTVKSAYQWLKLATDELKQYNFAIEVDGAAIGSIGVIPQEDISRMSAEIGYWLGEEYWGRGIATAALKAMTEYAFVQFNLCRVYAIVLVDNIGSIRVLEKAGYQLEGRMRRSAIKNGKILDEYLYANVKEDN